MGKWLRESAPSLVRDAFGFAGLASTAYGAWLIYHPAGFIVGGVIATGAVFWHARVSK